MELSECLEQGAINDFQGGNQRNLATKSSKIIRFNFGGHIVYT